MGVWVVAFQVKASDTLYLIHRLWQHVLCTGGEKDNFHMFFECPFTLAIWASQQNSQVDVTCHISRGLFGNLSREWKRECSLLFCGHYGCAVTR